MKSSNENIPIAERIAKYINLPDLGLEELDLSFVKENVQFEGKQGQLKRVEYKPVFTIDGRGSSGKESCEPRLTRFLTGIDTTDQNGERVIHIMDKLCPKPDSVANEIFVATANTSTPTAITFIYNSRDKTVKVMSFNSDGDRQRNVRFHWHISMTIQHFID